MIPIISSFNWYLVGWFHDVNTHLYIEIPGNWRLTFKLRLFYFYGWGNLKNYTIYLSYVGCNQKKRISRFDRALELEHKLEVRQRGFHNQKWQRDVTLKARYWSYFLESLQNLSFIDPSCIHRPIGAEQLTFRRSSWISDI